MLGIIGGTAIFNAHLPPLSLQRIATPFGPTDVLCGEKMVLLKRHQYTTPPSQINHRANIATLKILGVDKLIIICSVGGMKKKYPPGSIVIPSDFFSPWDIPTFHEHDLYHIGPSIDPDLRRKLMKIFPTALDGVYLQTRGPRFETKSEIALFAQTCDIVGMTGASEITLANELGSPAAAICTVDNYAAGITDEQVEYKSILEMAKKYRNQRTELITKICETFI